MRKAKFKWQVGQSVRFKFYDGSIHNGVIVSKGYRNEDSDYLDTQYSMPMYTCHSPDLSGRYRRGYMVYPSLSQTMIQFELDKPVIIKPLDEVPISEIGHKKPQATVQSITDRLDGYNESLDEVTESLDDAIAKQREFLNR